MVHNWKLPDPFVTVEILPSDKKNKKKTKSIKDNLNPIFDERFNFNLPYSEVKKKLLYIVVKNDKFFLSHEATFMGQVLNFYIFFSSTLWFKKKIILDSNRFE